MLLQEQVAQVVVDKVIQMMMQLLLLLQNLEQQEILRQQLLHKEIMVEMEFSLLVLQTHKQGLVEVVLVLWEQMQLNQDPMLRVQVLVVQV